jgi:serine/threonine protein phosphatase PrpC
MNLTFGASTARGNKKENQDDYCLWDLTGNRPLSHPPSAPLNLGSGGADDLCLLFGVFDGHGDAGKAAANTVKSLVVREFTADSIRSILISGIDPVAPIKEIFHQVFIHFLTLESL